MIDISKCSQRLVSFSNGERYPLLIDEMGVPLWYPTLFITTQFRNSNKASNTMIAALSAVRSLMRWGQNLDVDLEARFKNRKFLNDQEIESIKSFAQRKYNSKDDIDKSSGSVVKLSRRRIESARAGIQHAKVNVTSTTQYIRMTYMANYLEWFATQVVLSEAKVVDGVTQKLIDGMVNSLCKRRPAKSKPSRVNARKGLSKDQRRCLLALIKPGAVNNPFTTGLQERNYVIVLLLYYLGLREGELLAIQVADFDFQSNEVVIARRHDNADDPRHNQPVVKTLDRRLALSQENMKAIRDYVLIVRSKIPNAKRHKYLFVTHKRGPFLGQPLSIQGLVKVFSAIRNAEPEKLGDLTPHILRHTANDIYSELMDEQKVSPQEEEKTRSFKMGWKEGSGTAATYTRRHTEKKAREASLALQAKLIKDNADD
jgi:integrase